MTQNAIPGLSMLVGPNQPSKTTENNNAMLRYTKTISPRMLAVDGALYAPTPPPTPPTDAYLQISGYQSVTFTTGTGSIIFPVSFPNGILWASVTTLGVTNTVGVAGGGYSLTALPVVASTSGELVVLYCAIGW